MNKNLVGGLFDGRGKSQPLQASAKAKKIITPEENIQADLFGWIFAHENNYPVLEWLYHTPNGGFRHKSVAVKMKYQGVRSGVSDLSLPVARRGFHGLYIEMKSAIGKLQDSQREFLEFVAGEGYKTAVCWSARAAAEIIIEYLDLPITAKYLK